MNIDTGYYIELNETASELWMSFESDTTIENLEKYLLNNFSLSSALANKDISLFINDCLENSLITIIKE